MNKLLCTAALLSLLPACNLYFGGGGGGDDVICPQKEPAMFGLRNPDTGSCDNYGGGGGCGGAPDPTPIANPDWASCPGACEALDETTCLATSGCRAAYLDDSTNCPPNAACPVSQTFWGCWGTAPSGPIQGVCAGLDAQTCSEHDDCTATYSTVTNSDGSTTTQFAYCAQEPGTPTACLTDADCGAGYSCDTSVCIPPPNCDPNNGQPCTTMCYGQCVPAQDGCANVDCGPGAHCEEQCYPCDPADPTQMCPTDPCNPVCVPDAGTCSDGTVCPPGSTCTETCTVDPNGNTVCSDSCTPDMCSATTCAPGSHCETVCPVCNGPTDPMCGAPCSEQCVPDGVPDPGTCDGQVICNIAPPACPAGTVAGVLNGCWSGYCIPQADCSPNDPGSCTGDITCPDVPPPACPQDTVPGIRNGCYTGYCIPQSSCGTTQVPCDQLTTEADCTARMDCTPIYSGTGCTCYPDGTCTCDAWTFDRCETGGVVAPPPMPL
jgi:hypothetical protein